MWANGNDATGRLQWLNAFFVQILEENKGSALSVNGFVQRYLTSEPLFVSFRVIIAHGPICANAALRLKREHGMKRLIVIIALLSGSLWAQSSPSLDVPAKSSPANGPSYSQLYCSGFITRQAVPHTNFVLASKEAPHEDQIAGRSVIFLGGPGLAEGQRYSLLRQVEDPNREDSSPLQRKKLGKLGRLYEEVGWATVRSVQQGTAIATFDFSCDAAIPGDLVVPFQEKPAVSFRPQEAPVNSFLPAVGAPTGHILGSKEFIGLLGSGNIVYTDFGAVKGAKPGDYLFVRRGYATSDLNRIDQASEKLPRGFDSNAVNTAKPKVHADDGIPSHVLGEMLVLNVSAEASTALITRSFAEMELGDVVQGESLQATATGSEATVTTGNDAKPCGLGTRVRSLLHFHNCKQ